MAPKFTLAITRYNELNPKELTPSERSVLYAHAFFANNETGFHFASLESLARIANCSVRTAHSSNTRLAKLHLIRISCVRDQQGHRHNRYWITVPARYFSWMPSCKRNNETSFSPETKYKSINILFGTVNNNGTLACACAGAGAREGGQKTVANKKPNVQGSVSTQPVSAPPAQTAASATPATVAPAAPATTPAVPAAPTAAVRDTSGARPNQSGRTSTHNQAQSEDAPRRSAGQNALKPPENAPVTRPRVSVHKSHADEMPPLWKPPKPPFQHLPGLRGVKRGDIPMVSGGGSSVHYPAYDFLVDSMSPEEQDANWDIDPNNLRELKKDSVEFALKAIREQDNVITRKTLKKYRRILGAKVFFWEVKRMAYILEGGLEIANLSRRQYPELYEPNPYGDPSEIVDGSADIIHPGKLLLHRLQKTRVWQVATKNFTQPPQWELAWEYDANQDDNPSIAYSAHRVA